MGKKYILGIVLVLFFISVTAGFAASKTTWPNRLRFMSGPSGGNWFALGAALGEMWSKNTIQTTSSSGGGIANIININSKKGDIGFSVTALLGAAIAGEEDFNGRTIDNAVLMANLYPQFTYFIMRKDFAKKHGINTLGDVFNKKLAIRFATLTPGTASEFTFKALLKKAYGITYDDIKKWGGSVEFTSYEDGADLIADNHIDCLSLQVGQTASIVTSLEHKTDIVLLPVEQNKIQVMTDTYGFVPMTIKPGAYKSVTKPITVVGDYTCLIIRKDLPEDLVYALNKALWKNKESLASSVKDFEGFNPKEALSQKIPNHPGSEKFWKNIK